MIPRHELTEQFVEHMIDGLDVNDLARIVSAYMTADCDEMTEGDLFAQIREIAPHLLDSE
jgi:hypothetical protein